jgi:ribosomal protein S18 acetylase RimI-like enzyme
MKTLNEFLNESKEKLTYSYEHVNSYSGQDNYEIGVYIDDNIIGVIEYTTFEGELTISNITVLPKYRRRGVGSRLVQMMKDKHPTYKYKPSMKTADGAKFKHNKIKDLYSLD